ncbi:MAG: glycosyltransferase, partial [Fidelibacterota bacterium]
NSQHFQTAQVNSKVIDLSIIIVSYNVKEFLEQSLISIKRASANIKSEIIVVDNNSIDGSVELLENKFSEVILIKNAENLGFASANNQGMRISRGKFILLINPDTIVQEDTFKELIEFFRSTPDAGAVGCKILNSDGTLQLACRRSFPTPLVALPRILGLSRLFPKNSFFGRYNLTYLDPDEISEVDALSGSFIMVRREIIDEVGYLDEEFFMYGEDLDWCYRIKERGWKIYYVPFTKIIHYKGESSKILGFDNIRYFHKAMHLFVRKHFKKGYYLLFTPLLSAGIFLRGIASYLLNLVKSAVFQFIDVVFINLALVLAIRMKFDTLIVLPAYYPVMFIYTVVWIFACYMFGLYDRRRFSSSFAFMAVLTGFLVNVSFTFFFKQFAYSREVILWSLLFVLFFLTGWRIIIRLIHYTGAVPFLNTIGKAILSRRTLIVGTGIEGKRIARKLREKLDKGYNVVGFVDKKFPSDKFFNVNYLGKPDDLGEIIKIRKISDVIFTTDTMSYEQILEIIDKTRNSKINFKIVPHNLEFIIGKSGVDTIEDIPLVNLDYNINKFFNRALKRAFDFSISLFLIILSSPFILTYAVIRRYGFERVQIAGEGGSIFYAYLFRKKGDKIPTLIRKYPLLFSVLKGDLSFVGEEIEFNPTVSKKILYKPGLTGLIQLNSELLSEDSEKEKFEHYYLRNQSLLLDIELILKSLFKF